MKPRLKSTRAARELIKAFEPFHGEAVRRGKRWVVGYGHTAAAKSGVSLSRENAELLLMYDVLQAETAVHAALGEDISAPVRDALVSFAASVGLNAFKVSDVARLAKAGKLEAAAAALETWVRVSEDGRLVTSDLLVKRRAAEKALMLGLSGAPASAGAAPQIEAEPGIDTGSAAEAPQHQADPEPVSGPVARPGRLVDVDIAFEDPEDAAPAAAPDLEAEAEPAAAEMSDTPGAESASEPIETAPEIETPEVVESQPVAAATDPEAPAASEALDAADFSDAPQTEHGGLDEFEAGARKAAQDAAIKAVMSRMAGDISQSVSVAGVRRPETAPEPEAQDASQEDAAQDASDAHQAQTDAAASPARDLSTTQLGYSFLQPDVVGWDFYDEDDDEPEAAPLDAAGADSAPSETADASPEPGPEEAAGPGKAVASAAPGPVYATVSVGLVQRTENAPPHPAEAPAAAPGMSGESEGPDHHEDGEAEDMGEDEAELEPALVAGPEAHYESEETPPGAVEGRGDWVHGANLVAGTALAGLGAWQIMANMDAYLSAGLGYNWIPPGLFAGGVLLLVSSGWVVVGKLTSKKA
ncbi:glycoside hydrolase family protein [Maricaulaceae bacterium MS644]